MIAGRGDLCVRGLRVAPLILSSRPASLALSGGKTNLTRGCGFCGEAALGRIEVEVLCWVRICASKLSWVFLGALERSCSGSLRAIRPGAKGIRFVILDSSAGEGLKIWQGDEAASTELGSWFARQGRGDGAVVVYAGGLDCALSWMWLLAEISVGSSTGLSFVLTTATAPPSRRSRS
jgi:hypothetical protein